MVADIRLLPLLTSCQKLERVDSSQQVATVCALVITLTQEMICLHSWMQEETKRVLPQFSGNAEKPQQRILTGCCNIHFPFPAHASPLLPPSGKLQFHTGVRNSINAINCTCQIPMVSKNVSILLFRELDVHALACVNIRSSCFFRGLFVYFPSAPDHKNKQALLSLSFELPDE